MNTSPARTSIRRMRPYAIEPAVAFAHTTRSEMPVRTAAESPGRRNSRIGIRRKPPPAPISVPSAPTATPSRP